MVEAEANEQKMERWGLPEEWVAYVCPASLASGLLR